MTTNDNAPNVPDLYESSRRNWEMFTKGEERAYTMRSIFVTVRLAMARPIDKEDLSDVIWLLHLGECLADISASGPKGA